MSFFTNKSTHIKKKKKALSLNFSVRAALLSMFVQKKQISEVKKKITSTKIQIWPNIFSWVVWSYQKRTYWYLKDSHEKSRIWETMNLSTDADSSTDTTVGWTKNTQKPKKNNNKKSNPKRKNSKNL